MNKILLLFIFMFSLNITYAQFFTEDFDDVTGTATLIPNGTYCNDNNENYFGIVCLSGGGCGNEIGPDMELTGGDGGSFFAAHDVDHAPCTDADDVVGFLIDDINIMGQTDLHVCFEIAEDDDGGNQDWDNDTKVTFSYDVDNSGTFSNIISVATTQEPSPNNNNKEPRLDTDCDGEGDGAVITNVFTTYCFVLMGTGNLLDLNVETIKLDAGDEDIAIDNIQLFSGGGSLPAAVTAACEAPPTTSVEFSTTSITSNEATPENAIDLTISISNPDASVATTGDVVISTGDAADVNAYTTQSFTFAAGDATDQTVTITITDDVLMEPTEDIVFEITNVAGGTMAAVGTNNQFTLSILDNDTPPSPLVISEIMYNTPDSNDDEWIEICNTSASPIDVNGYDIVVVTGVTLTFGAALDVPAMGCITVALGDGNGVAYNDDCIFAADADLSDGSTNRLANSSRTIVLQDASDVVVDEVTYSSADGANGNGPSLILTDLTLDNASTGNDNWIESSNAGGSPGEAGDGGCTNTTTTVQFTTTSASSSENTPENTIDLTISITNPDAVNATTGMVEINAGDAADINAYTTQMFTFAAGDAMDQTITITITDDALLESPEDIVFEITGVTGGNAAIVGINNLFTLTINDNDTPIADIAITEWMNNPLGTEPANEWFEIYNYGTTTVDLMGYSVTDAAPGTFDITTSTPIDPGAYIVFAFDKAAFEASWLGGVASPKVIQYTGISSLGNSSDALTLTDDGGNTVWSVSWINGETAGVSVEIRPDFDFDNLPVNHPTYVHNNYPGSTHYVNTSAAASSVDGDSGTPCGDSAPLAVSLMTFNGKLIDNQVQLNWMTATETNNDFFSIQRSVNNKDFVEIGKQAGEGTILREKAYSFVDVTPVMGLNYYRLAQVDFNGTTTFSETISVAVTEKDGILIYPTIVDDMLTVEFGQALDKMQTLDVFDVNGKLVQTYKVETGLLKTTLDVAVLNSGIYFVKTSNGQSLKFVKK